MVLPKDILFLSILFVPITYVFRAYHFFHFIFTISIPIVISFGLNFQKQWVLLKTFQSWFLKFSVSVSSEALNRIKILFFVFASICFSIQYLLARLMYWPFWLINKVHLCKNGSRKSPIHLPWQFNTIMIVLGLLCQYVTFHFRTLSQQTFSFITCLAYYRFVFCSFQSIWFFVDRRKWWNIVIVVFLFLKIQLFSERCCCSFKGFFQNFYYKHS